MMKESLSHGLVLGLGALALCGTQAAAQTPVFNPANGHYYDAVATPGGLAWDLAKVQAEGMSYLGAQGHLVTITDDPENTFVYTQVVAPNANQYWIGGYQDRNAPDYSEPDGGWRWVTGEDWNFTAWFAPGEPNNTGGNEDYATFDHQVPFWNDAVLDYFWNAGFLVEYDMPPGVAFCSGDPGSGTACPCGNDNNGSGGGCDWGDAGFPGGGVLDATGSDSMAANDTLLVATGISNNFGIFFGADNQVNGGDGNPLNDGLRCAGGGLVRLIPPTAATGNQTILPQPVQTLDSGAAAGATRRYQYWFRTPSGPCGLMANLTNGYEITWLP